MSRKNHAHDCWSLMGMTGGGAWAAPLFAGG